MVLAAQGGKLGAGKTVTLTREAYYFYKMGYKIYTNYKLLKIPHTQIYDKEEILDIGLADPNSKKFFALDEGYLFFDALEKSSANQQYNRNLINITRKMNMVVYFTTQTMGQVNLRTRLLFDFIMLPKYYKKTRKLKINYYICTLSGQYMWIKKKTYKRADRFFQFFQTGEIINEFIKQANQEYHIKKGKKTKTIQLINQTDLESFAVV